MKREIITDSLLAWYYSRILTQMNIDENITNHFLIAMPSLKDPIFAKSVVYIYEYSSEGAMGLVINKLLQIPLGDLLQHLEIEVKDASILETPVLTGGPVAPEQGFVIHDSLEQGGDKTSRSITISSSKKILSNMALGVRPENFLIVLGYSAWIGGQLETEIKCNDWLIVPFHKEILFDTPIENRWEAAAQKIGVDIKRISDQVGHA